MRDPDRTATHSLSIFSKAAADPAAFLVVPSLKIGFNYMHTHLQPEDVRDKHNIPLSSIQSSILELLKIDSFLLQLLLSRRDIFQLRDVTTILSNSSEMWR